MFLFACFVFYAPIRRALFARNDFAGTWNELEGLFEKAFFGELL